MIWEGAVIGLIVGAVVGAAYGAGLFGVTKVRTRWEKL